MGPRKWPPKWGPETGPQNGVLKVDPKMEPLSWKCFDLLLDQHHGPLSGVYFLDPILGPVSGPPFWGPLSGTPFRSPQWIQKTKIFVLCCEQFWQQGSRKPTTSIELI